MTDDARARYEAAIAAADEDEAYGLRLSWEAEHGPEEPPIDLAAAWAEHQARSLVPRNDGRHLHASDLHSCDYALHQRLAGTAPIPFGPADFGIFEVGHVWEARIQEAVRAYVEPKGYRLEWGEQVAHDGIIGNLDFSLYKGPECVAVVDVSTTKKPAPRDGALPEASYGHTLKTAFYALAKGARRFAEFVIRLGYGGEIKGIGIYWFDLDDEETPGRTWRQAIFAAIAHAKAVAAGPQPKTIPPTNPIDGELEAWRCGSKPGMSYCQAICPLNMKHSNLTQQLTTT